jgi:HAD superfamily hydrolase (TIGR01509 family)
MDEKGLGARLQAARQAAGLTQQQLCHQASLSFSTLTKIERGAIKSPSIFTIQAIAGALGVSLDELVGHSAGKTMGRQLRTTRSGAKFIYFDVNGCLIHFYQRAFVKIAAATGAPPDTIETAYLHYNDQVCRGDLSLEEFNVKLGKRLGVERIRWQDFYLEIVEPINEMQELLKWAAEHYKVGLLTNIMPGMLKTLRQTGKLPDLSYDSIIDSSEVRAIKPEAKVYEIAQARAGCPPEEILLIDDSRANLIAAEKQGWHVMWFDDSHVNEAVDRVRAALQPA